MRLILAGCDEEVGHWVAARSRHLILQPRYTALGLVDENRQILAGVVYDNYHGYDLQMHVAAVPGRAWLSRHFLKEAFRYPFEQLCVDRITGLVPARNLEAQRFDEHLGFVLEGRARRALPDGDDLLIYGMLREECRWITQEQHDGRQRLSATGT